MRTAVRIVTLARHNVVKLAISLLKGGAVAGCRMPEFDNHLVRSAARAEGSKRAPVLHLDPVTLLYRSRALAVSRARFEHELSSHPWNGTVLQTSYEAMQLDPEAALRRVLVHLFGASHAALRPLPPGGTSTVKSSKEDLSTLLLNFAKLNATFARWPCLQAQLLSTEPALLPTCDPDGLLPADPPPGCGPVGGRIKGQNQFNAMLKYRRRTASDGTSVCVICPAGSERPEDHDDGVGCGTNRCDL